MDLSDLPQSAQDRIAAAEIEADSILANSRAAANELGARANWGIDPLGIDYLLGDIPMELDLARQELTEGRDRAAGHLFAAIAGEYIKQGKLDTGGFNAKLEIISEWVFKKFHPSQSFLDDFKLHCRVVALRKRASALEAIEGLDSKKTELARSPAEALVCTEGVDGQDGDKTDRQAAINAFILKVAHAGRRIKRKNIWTVAGYSDPTEFERFQRNDARTTRSAAAAFNRTLSMKPEEFIRLLDKKIGAK